MASELTWRRRPKKKAGLIFFAGWKEFCTHFTPRDKVRVFVFSADSLSAWLIMSGSRPSKDGRRTQLEEEERYSLAGPLVPAVVFKPGLDTVRWHSKPDCERGTIFSRGTPRSRGFVPVGPGMLNFHEKPDIGGGGKIFSRGPHVPAVVFVSGCNHRSLA